MVCLTIIFTKCNIYFDILYKFSENFIEISQSQPLLQPLKQSEAKVKIYTPTDYWFCFTASLILVLLGKDCEKSIFLKLFVLEDFYFPFCTSILLRSIKLCKSNPYGQKAGLKNLFLMISNKWSHVKFEFDL